MVRPPGLLSKYKLYAFLAEFGHIRLEGIFASNNIFNLLKVSHK